MTERICPGHDLTEGVPVVRRLHRQPAVVDSSVKPADGDIVSSGEFRITDPKKPLFLVDGQVRTVGDAAHTLPPCQGCGIDGAAARRRQNTVCVPHAGQPLRGNIPADQNRADAPAHFFAGILRRENNLTTGCAGGRRRSPGDERRPVFVFPAEAGMYQVLHLVGSKAHHCFPAGDEFLLHHIHRCLHRRLGGAAGRCRLQDVQSAGIH